MSDETNNPDAQGQQGAAEQAQTTNSEVESSGQRPQGEGVQRRIDELTARRHQAERMAEQLQVQNAELTSQLTQILMRQAQPQVEAPPQMDHDERRRYEAMMAPLKAELAATRAQMQQQLETVQFSQAASGQPPEVQQRAQQLLAGWRKAGLQGWNVQDALVYAAGQVAMERAQGGGSFARDERGRFNGGSTNFPTGQPPNPTLNPQSKEVPVPGDIDSWPAEKQAAFWEKKLGGKAF